jgi:hypothetical protein
MSNRGGRNNDLWMMPGHPVREEMEFCSWMDTHPIPWPELAKTTHRLCLSTAPSRYPQWTSREGDDDLPYLANPYDE